MALFNDSQDLFLQKLIDDEVAKTRFDPVKVTNLKSFFEKYSQILKADKILKEEEKRQSFLKDLFTLLSYEEYQEFAFEGTTEIDSTKPDGRLGSNLKKDSKVEVVIEWKGSNINLDQLTGNPVTQAWNYVSGFDGCMWYIVGNFKEIRLFNRNFTRKQYQSFDLDELAESEKKVKEFILLFHKENLLKNSLSKSFLENLLDQNRARKDIITDEFYSEFKHYRNIVFNHLKHRYADQDAKVLLHTTQSILDKITFIQFASSRSLLSTKILEKHIEISKNIPQNNDRFWYVLTGLFRSIDEGNKYVKPEIFGYNGELFKYDKKLESISLSDNILEEVLNFFAKYDFNNELSLDVLGRIFEQSISDLEEMKFEIDTNALIESNIQIKLDKPSKRKKDGVFYTPEYITKYITQTVIDSYLSENSEKIGSGKIDIKILDPACGSGAFLNQAHSVLQEKYQDFIDKFKVFGSEDFDESLTKEYDKNDINQNILLNNLYGVDLNAESVEITKLSLWLKTISKNHKMHSLVGNIKQGNSLIDDPEIGGEDSLNWEKEFGHLKEQGENFFDIIVGNPPYGATLDEKQQKYLLQKYNLGSTETAILFILQSLEILKDGGYIGFIIPKSFCFASNYAKLREVLWSQVVEIIDCGKVWNEVKLEQVIVILQKGGKHDFYLNKTRNGDVFEGESRIDKNISTEFGFFLNGVTDTDIQKAQIIKQNSVMLNDIAENKRGAMLQKFISDKGDLEVIGGAEIDRYGIVGVKGKIEKMNINININDNKAYIQPNSILVQRIVSHIENPIPHIKIIACLPEKVDYILVDTINQISLQNKYSTKFIWAVLNSEICNWYLYNFVFGKAIRTIQFDNPTTSALPIPRSTSEEQTEISLLVDEILSLHKELESVIYKHGSYLENRFKIKSTAKLSKFYDLEYTQLEEEMKKQCKTMFTRSDEEKIIDGFEKYKSIAIEISQKIDHLNQKIEENVRKLYGV